MVVACASQNVSITGCRFSHTRHAVTTGGSSGSLLNGVQRNIVVSNCTSMISDTAHFDTHDPAENVSYVGCVAIGGVPASKEVIGFQMRGANSSIVGCSVLQAIGKGILIFVDIGDPRSHEGSDGATITGNMIAGVAAGGATHGAGIVLAGPDIRFPGPGTSRHAITGNVIKQCDGAAILGENLNNDVVVSGNVMDGTNLKTPGASISFDNAQRITITGNKIINNQNGGPIEMNGTSKGWQIADNSFAQNNSNAPDKLSIDSTVINNSGYNPVGIVASVWHPTADPTVGDLTNNGGGDAVPASGRVYTVRQTPKTIIIAGGTVTVITIDGTPTGLAGGVFKLGIGETIKIAYTLAPTSQVSAD
jgi:hypothetical protein